MATLFANVAAQHPTREAIVADSARLNYAELNARAEVIAKRLQDLGVGKHTIIGTLLLDGLAMVELTIATAKLGCTLLALNWRLAPAELSYIMGDAAADMYFVSDVFETLFEEAGGSEGFFVEPGNPAGALGPMGGTADFDSKLQLDYQVCRSDRWYMLYTSGTTGKPKGCQHSQGGYFTNVLSWLSKLGISDKDCLLSQSPLFHVHGFGTLLCALVSGAKIVIPPRDYDVEQVLRLTSKEQVTFQHLWQDPAAVITKQTALNLPLALRLIIAPGGGLPTDFIQNLVASGIDLRFIYGQTEVGCWATMMDVKDQIAHPASCGKPLPHLSTRIVNDGGVDLPHGEVGELLIKGDSITMGYHNLPEDTAATIVNGCLHTGDLVYQDPEGFLYIAGRKKELIKTGGENVYPAEVDSVLVKHPEIIDAAVTGIADPKWGEAVKAFVVLTPGSILTRHEIVSHCREHIAGYKKPRYIEFVDEIPRDFSKKIQRRKLAERETTAEQAVN